MKKEYALVAVHWIKQTAEEENLVDDVPFMIAMTFSYWGRYFQFLIFGWVNCSIIYWHIGS